MIQIIKFVVLSILGTASSPVGVTIQPVGLSGLLVNMTIPLYGSECVDEYSTSIEGLNGQTFLRLNKSVIDVHQRGYTFFFAFDLCQAPGEDITTVSVVSNTNGVYGAAYTQRSQVLHTLDRSSKFCNV